MRVPDAAYRHAGGLTMAYRALGQSAIDVVEAPPFVRHLVATSEEPEFERAGLRANDPSVTFPYTDETTT